MICVNHSVLLSCSCFTCFERRTHCFKLEFFNFSNTKYLALHLKMFVGILGLIHHALTQSNSLDCRGLGLDLQHKRFIPSDFGFASQYIDDKLLLISFITLVLSVGKGKMFFLRARSQETWILFPTLMQASCLLLNCSVPLSLKLIHGYLLQREIVKDILLHRKYFC